MFFNVLSAFTGVNEEKDYQPTEFYEEQIMGFEDLKKDKDFKIYDVKLPKCGGHIHTIEAGFDDKSKPVLVLVHGYASSSAAYFRCIKELISTFHIYSIDLYGMGASARPFYDKADFDEAVAFFVEPMEEWRKELSLPSFVLAGHSMGGYLCVHWALKKNLYSTGAIKMLYLISPAGFTNKTMEELEKESQKEAENGKKKGPPLPRWLFNWAFTMLREKVIAPFSFSIFGMRGTMLKYFSSPRLKLTKEQAEVFTDNFVRNINQRISGEKALGPVLRYIKYNDTPLVDMLAKQEKGKPPVRVFYGEADWMDHEHSSESLKTKNLGIDLTYISDCDHQIIFQNPKELSSKFIVDWEQYKGDYSKYAQY